MDKHSYALFAVPAVIFPGGLLQLRVVEPRYLGMVADYFRSGVAFGICTAEPAGRHAFSVPRGLGTLVDIVDFDRLDDGTLGIVVAGRRRFESVTTVQADDGLWRSEVRFLKESADSVCPVEFAPLKQVAAALIEEGELPYDKAGFEYDSASWLSARLTELLPFEAAIKHELLAIDNPLERLHRIRPMVEIEVPR